MIADPRLGSSTTGAWHADERAIAGIARGAGVLGSGGGGSAYLGGLLAMRAVREHGPVTFLPPNALPARALVVAVAQLGAPVVFGERLARGTECLVALEALEAYLGAPAEALLCQEIGGVNSAIPLLVAAARKLPVLDADAMGRAFPELGQDVFAIAGTAPMAAAVCGGAGTVTLIPGAETATLQRLIAAMTLALGGIAYLARAIPGAELARLAIPASYSRALAIGRSLDRAVRNDAIDRCDLSDAGGRVLCSGRVAALERQAGRGGTLQVVPWPEVSGPPLRIDFQNEYLLARWGSETAASTPDVIAMVDDASGEPVSTEELEVGRRVVVLAVDADVRSTTPEALRCLGPAAFGYEVAYRRSR